ncbi:hypothetical protein JHK87_035641 [Glycine soja]|nr:hypothetical protein JHK87_035641 [Glycine soja]
MAAAYSTSALLTKQNKESSINLNMMMAWLRMLTTYPISLTKRTIRIQDGLSLALPKVLGAPTRGYYSGSFHATLVTRVFGFGFALTRKKHERQVSLHKSGPRCKFDQLKKASFKDEGASAANVSFWSVGVSENKNDDYDCESEGPYGTRSSAALIVTSSEEVSFFEAYLDEGMWKEHVIDFHIQKLKKLTKGHT